MCGVSEWWEKEFTWVIAAAHLNMGVVDAEHPAARVAHVGGALHVDHIMGAWARNVEIALAIAGVKTCLGRAGVGGQGFLRGVEAQAKPVRANTIPQNSPTSLKHRDKVTKKIK